MTSENKPEERSRLDTLNAVIIVGAIILSATLFLFRTCGPGVLILISIVIAVALVARILLAAPYFREAQP